MDYNFSAGDIEASNLPPILSKPYCGEACLISVESIESKGYDVIDFSFKVTEEGELKGHQYRYRLFEHKDRPNTTDPEADAMKWGKHLAYLMSYFIGADAAIKVLNQSKSWQSLRANIVKAFDHFKGWDEKTVRIKVSGYVNPNTGKPSLGFPKYLGFVSDSQSEHQVSFSTKELQQNAAYLVSIANAVNSTSSDDLMNTSDTEVEDDLTF